jgi:hypothetical protein
MSCQNQPSSSEKSNNAASVDSAKAVAQKIIDYSNKLDFATAFQYYSADSDARYIENGAAYPSLAAMKDAYNQLVPALDLLENTVKSWDVVVLNSDAVLFTLPIHAKIKAKNRPEYQFDYVWSAVIQKRNGKWMLIQSHESWVNAAEVMAAIAPPPQNK